MPKIRNCASSFRKETLTTETTILNSGDEGRLMSVAVAPAGSVEFIAMIENMCWLF